MSKTPKGFDSLDKARTNKVPSLSKFSHELKTPLHGILGLTNFLRENWDNIQERQKKECVNSIIDAAQTMSIIVDLMIENNIDKDEIRFQFEKIDIVSILGKFVKQFGRLYCSQQDIKIEFISPKEEILIQGDIFWLGQVISNILSNAYSYTKVGVVRVNIEKEADYCFITIKDQGPGIEKKCLETIFEPFNKGTGGNKRSTGLGLAICREIIEEHKGTIAAKNYDNGAIIEIKLPVING